RWGPVGGHPLGHHRHAVGRAHHRGVGDAGHHPLVGPVVDDLVVAGAHAQAEGLGGGAVAGGGHQLDAHLGPLVAGVVHDDALGRVAVPGVAVAISTVVVSVVAVAARVTRPGLARVPAL